MEQDTMKNSLQKIGTLCKLFEMISVDFDSAVSRTSPPRELC